MSPPETNANILNNVNIFVFILDKLADVFF